MTTHPDDGVIDTAFERNYVQTLTANATLADLASSEPRRTTGHDVIEQASRANRAIRDAAAERMAELLGYKQSFIDAATRKQDAALAEIRQDAAIRSVKLETDIGTLKAALTRKEHELATVNENRDRDIKAVKDAIAAEKAEGLAGIEAEIAALDRTIAGTEQAIAAMARVAS